MQANGQELRQFIERIETLEKERAEIAELVKEVKAEAKGRGYCVPTLSRLISDRKKDKDDLNEERCIYEIYAAAIGMQ